MVPDEEIVLAALYSQWQTNAATRQNLNIVSADYVDYKGFDFFKDVITMDEVKFGVPPGVPLAPTITQLFPGDGGVSLGWTEVNGPGLDPVTSYTVTATNETDPKAPPVTFTISDTDGVLDRTDQRRFVRVHGDREQRQGRQPAAAGGPGHGGLENIGTASGDGGLTTAGLPPLAVPGRVLPRPPGPLPPRC